MALSNKVHQKTKMILSDRFDCYDDLVGDGTCDDECNTEDNSWDGGDGCGPDLEGSEGSKASKAKKAIKGSKASKASKAMKAMKGFKGSKW